MTCPVLLVEDDRAFAETLSDDLRSRGWPVRIVSSVPAALELLQTDELGVVVADVRVQGALTGLDLCARVSAAYPDVPVVVITGFGSLDTAIEAIRAGAYDFVAKPFDTDALAIALDRAAAHRALRQELVRLRRAVAEAPPSGDFVGTSRAMLRVGGLIERIAPTDAAVLVTGESGTGKQVAARILHERSARAKRPFLSTSCAALPEPLLEAELFGSATQPGVFERAKGGTVFLEEVADLPLALQARLLRALQERTVRPVGSEVDARIDVRIIAGTDRDLEAAIERRMFREDLYFRLNVIQLELPPLRAREGDVLLLAQVFIERAAERAAKRVKGLSPSAARTLAAYDFPGNVRELQNAMERAVAMTRYVEIQLDDLPARIREHRPTHVLVTGDDPNELLPMEEVERRYILRVLEAVGGHRARAAKILGLDRKTLYRKLVRYKVADPEDGEEKAS